MGGDLMAHFAKVEKGIVTQVIVLANGVTGEPDAEFPATEGTGQSFISDKLRLTGDWKQTSYNDSFRFNYAGVGYTFDSSKGTDGAFIPPKPFPSWVLDEDTCLWVAPVAMPDDGEAYVWDEESESWVAAPEAEVE